MNAPGRPMMYRTTDEFLKMFGYTSLKDLPELPDLRESINEDKQYENQTKIEEETDSNLSE